MGAAWHDLHCEQGATFTRKITYEEEDGTAIDLSGWTGRMQIRRAHGAAEALVDLTTGNGVSLPAATGEFTISMSAAETAALPADPTARGVPPLTRLVYDIEITSPAGQVERLLEGCFILHPEVTL